MPSVLFAVLLAVGKKHLEADADAEHRSARRYPLAHDLRTVDRVETAHARGKRTDSGYHEAVGGQRSRSVGGHLDLRAESAQCALGGAQIPRPVVENDERARHRLEHALGARDADNPVEPDRIAQRPSHRFELRLVDVVRVAAF